MEGGVVEVVAQQPDLGLEVALEQQAHHVGCVVVDGVLQEGLPVFGCLQFTISGWAISIGSRQRSTSWQRSTSGWIRYAAT